MPWHHGERTKVLIPVLQETMITFIQVQKKPLKNNKIQKTEGNIQWNTMRRNAMIWKYQYIQWMDSSFVYLNIKIHTRKQRINLKGRRQSQKIFPTLNRPLGFIAKLVVTGPKLTRCTAFREAWTTHHTKSVDKINVKV